MAVQARSTTSLLGQAIVAGVIGGIVVDAFLSLVMHASPIGIWTFVAATAVGQGTPWIIGLVVHFVISIVWAILYLYAFGALGQLKNWIVGAIAWGIVVDAVMNLLITLKVGAPWWPGFAQGLLAHIVFYAAPVTFYLARTSRTA
ncbi:MAG TPA: hypothetical protein VMD47_08205 [Candidatus Acidoferrales bacterium]|nr:hypothetical protein [Candidatus Acidoferrales bacterium]